MKIEVSKETQEFVKTASDRELQNQIYVTLRQNQVLQERIACNSKTLVNLAIWPLIAGLVIGFIFVINHAG